MGQGESGRDGNGCVRGWVEEERGRWDGVSKHSHHTVAKQR